GGALRLGWLGAVLCRAERQIKEGAENEALSLMMTGESAFRPQIERILWLLIEVRGVVERFREGITRRKCHLTGQPSSERDREAMVGRAGGVFELVDRIKARVAAARTEPPATDLVRRRVGNPQARRVLRREGDGRWQIDIPRAGQLHSAHEEVVGARREVPRQQTLDTKVGLLTVGRRLAWIWLENRWTKNAERRWPRPARRLPEETGRLLAVSHLLERLPAVFLDRPIQKRQHVAVGKDTETGAQRPTTRRAVSQSYSRADVVSVLIEPLGQALKIVAQAEIHGQSLTHRPVVLNKATIIHDRKGRACVPEGLSIRVGVTGEIIGQAAKEVDGAEPVWRL